MRGIRILLYQDIEGCRDLIGRREGLVGRDKVGDRDHTLDGPSFGTGFM